MHAARREATGKSPAKVRRSLARTEIWSGIRQVETCSFRFGGLGGDDFSEFLDQLFVERVHFTVVVVRESAKQGVAEIGVLGAIPLNTIQHPASVGATHSSQA